MKGIILCGGRGTRLQPITYTVPKQLIPIANRPLLVYTIELLFNSGISEIGIIVNNYNKSIFQSTLSKYFNHDFQYIIQENPQGIAHGLSFAEKFVDNEKFVMVLGDNSFDTSLKEFVVDFITNKKSCKILLKEVDNPEKYGVAYIGNDKIINLEEKPKRAFSNWAITGLYAFDKNIFKAIKEIKPSSRKEYEITDAIKWLLQNGYDIDYEILDGHWRDVGSPKDVVDENANRLSYIINNIKGELINSHVSGKVVLEDGAVIYNSIIRGPIIVGENSIIKYSYIGPYTSIGKGVNIDKSNIENSIIFDDCTISGVGIPIDNSIIGEGSIINKEKGLKKANRLVIGKSTKLFLPNI
ncbi:glucose-1-phosphate thymidylyltransferase [Clostridium sp. Cult2]|uniref:glucose-1-phosphate thymidylyltransferase n=1 Tax=Clostridium sp. Cult2 TaxID=2079003 RepID=UPI001F0241F2|nr:glucose-1-phosphate thymidylyltransferase [Clostridium sp. Cult2]